MTQGRDVQTNDPSLKAAHLPTMAELDRLWQRGTAFLGSRYAIMGGGMTWGFERHLVSAISNARGFGVLAFSSMTSDLLAKEIAATQALTKAPFGVNLITLHPQLLDLVDTCLANKVSHIVLAGGLPPAAAITRAKDGGAKVLCFAPAVVL